MEEIETGSEVIESGVETGASSDASTEGSESGAAQAAPKQEQQTETTPFHEHPRFKELVEQKNEALRQYQAMQAQYKAIEQQVTSLRDSQPKPPSETERALEELKAVHPGLAATIKAALQGSETAKQLQDRLDAFEKQSHETAKQQIVTTAVSKINSLHESNKMSDFGKQFINNQLSIAHQSGKLNAADLRAVEAAYSESAKAIKTYEESLKRDVTKSYVQNKAKDASVPTSVPKGAQAKPAQKQTPALQDKDALKSAVVKSFLKDQVANRAATNN